MREKFSDEALAFYNKHRREIDASVKRAVCIIVESLDPGACPQAVSAMIWNCVKRAVESYFRSGQTAGMVVGKNIMLLIAPHPQGVSINFGHIIDSRVLKQPPRVVPSIKRTRRSVAKMLSDAFAKFGVNHEGLVQEIMISSSDVAKLRSEKPGVVIEGEILGIPYKLVSDGEALWVR